MLPLATMSRRIELSASMQFAKVPVWGQQPRLSGRAQLDFVNMIRNLTS